MKEEPAAMITCQNSSDSSHHINPSPPSELKNSTGNPKDNHIQSQSLSSNPHHSHNNQTEPQSPSSKTHLSVAQETAFQSRSPTPLDVSREPITSKAPADDTGRERLKRHRIEVAGRVWIPDIWGQEELLKDWIDCSALDACLVPSGIMSARAALVQEGRRANSRRLRIENRC